MKRDYFYIVAIILLLMFGFQSWRAKFNMKKINKANLTVLNDSIRTYKNSLGLMVSEKLAFQGTKKELQGFLNLSKKDNKQLKVALKKYKKLASVTEIVTEIKIDSFYVPFEIKIPCTFERSFIKEDLFYTIAGDVNESGIAIADVRFKNHQTIVIGKKKSGFLKTEYKVSVTNSNPYMQTNSLDNYSFTERKKRFGIGLSLGFGMHSNGFFLGPSLNYNIIHF